MKTYKAKVEGFNGRYWKTLLPPDTIHGYHTVKASNWHTAFNRVTQWAEAYMKARKITRSVKEITVQLQKI